MLLKVIVKKVHLQWFFFFFYFSEAESGDSSVITRCTDNVTISRLAILFGKMLSSSMWASGACTRTGRGLNGSLRKKIKKRAGTRGPSIPVEGLKYTVVCPRAEIFHSVRRTAPTLLGRTRLSQTVFARACACVGALASKSMPAAVATAVAPPPPAPRTHDDAHIQAVAAAAADV